MPFFIFSNADVQFNKREFIWILYITAKIFLTTQKVKLIDREDFAKAELDENIKTFMVHISFLSMGSKMKIYPDEKNLPSQKSPNSLVAGRKNHCTSQILGFY